MKEVINEYGSSMMAAMATVLILALFSVMVFGADGVVAKNIRGYADGYAGKKMSDIRLLSDSIKTAERSIPELKAKKSLFAKRKYDISDLFFDAPGYEMRAARVILLDDILDYESEIKRGNMVLFEYDKSGEDVTELTCSDGGKKLCFDHEGYYAVKISAADGSGRRTSGSYIISVRRAKT